nr:unnamed protein product [Digitaria exilis]
MPLEETSPCSLQPPPHPSLEPENQIKQPKFQTNPSAQKNKDPSLIGTRVDLTFSLVAKTSPASAVVSRASFCSKSERTHTHGRIKHPNNQTSSATNNAQSPQRFELSKRKTPEKTPRGKGGAKSRDREIRAGNKNPEPRNTRERRRKNRITVGFKDTVGGGGGGGHGGRGLLGFGERARRGGGKEGEGTERALLNN